MTPQALADKKKDVMDEDILALVSDEVHQPEKLWDVLDLQVNPPSCCMLSCGRTSRQISLPHPFEIVVIFQEQSLP